MKHLLILGASRGLGAAFNLGLPEPGDRVWLVSRTPPALAEADGVRRTWIQADLAAPEAAAAIAQAVAGERLDAVIYNAGIWEASAFGRGYEFERVPPEENARIIAVNLTAAVHCLQKLLPHLRRSENPKLILISSISGVENNPGHEVAYNASKFGLRGAAQALRTHLRAAGVGVTVINPGTIATQEPPTLSAAAVAEKYQGREIPLPDLVALVKCVLSLSRATVVKEIDVPALGDEGV